MENNCVKLFRNPSTIVEVTVQTNLDGLTQARLPLLNILPINIFVEPTCGERDIVVTMTAQCMCVHACIKNL